MAASPLLSTCQLTVIGVPPKALAGTAVKLGSKSAWYAVNSSDDRAEVLSARLSGSRSAEKASVTTARW